MNDTIRLIFFISAYTALMWCIYYAIVSSIKGGKRNSWRVVINEKGKYSFITWRGVRSEAIFNSYEAAYEAAMQDREWSNRYDGIENKPFWRIIK